MAEESNVPAEAATAVVEGPEGESAEGSAGANPIPIERDLLTAEARSKAAEESGKPVEDLPYAIKGEEKLPHSIVSLNIEVPADTLGSELDRYYAGLRKDVTLPGFRKGKAPVKLLRIRLGRDGDKEAMQEIAVNTLRQEVLKREMNLLADAQIVSWTLEHGKPLEMEVHLETQPEVKLEKYKGLKIEVERAEFKPEMVDGELDRLRSQHARQESAAEGAGVKEGDAIVVDISVTGQGGKELGHMGRQNLIIRDFKSELPAELADQIEGKKVGETVKADIETERKSRRGESIKHTDTYAVTIRDIKVTRIPELDDEFAKDLGEFDTLAELRESVEKRLRERFENSRKQNSLARLMAALVENNPVEAPHSLVGQAQYRSMMNDSMQLAQMGLRLEDVVQDSDSYMHHQHHQAELLIKQGLLRAELAKVEKLEVTDEDIEQEIARLAEEQGRKPLAVRAKLEADKKLDGLHEEILSRRITDFLMEHNTIVEVEPKQDEEAGEAEDAGEATAKKPAKKTTAKKSAAKPGGAKTAKAKADEGSEPKASPKARSEEAKPARKSTKKTDKA